jgi:hypothetical protein
MGAGHQTLPHRLATLGHCDVPAADAPREAEMSDVASKHFVLACTLAVLVVMLVLHFAPRGPTTGTTDSGAVHDFTVDQTSSGLEITVAARATSALSNLGVSSAKQPHVGMLNRPANQDGCRGASLTLADTASGTLEQ